MLFKCTIYTLASKTSFLNVIHWLILFLISNPINVAIIWFVWLNSNKFTLIYDDLFVKLVSIFRHIPTNWSTNSKFMLFVLHFFLNVQQFVVHLASAFRCTFKKYCFGIYSYFDPKNWTRCRLQIYWLQIVCNSQFRSSLTAIVMPLLEDLIAFLVPFCGLYGTEVHTAPATVSFSLRFAQSMQRNKVRHAVVWFDADQEEVIFYWVLVDCIQRYYDVQWPFICQHILPLLMSATTLLPLLMSATIIAGT